MGYISAKNGSTFEKALITTLDAYRSAGVCDLEKVDPPTKTFGKRIVHLANPFLDFIGPWGENGGQLLMVECKSTESPTLPIDTPKSPGITRKQLLAGLRWHRAGAAVAYLWQYRGEVRLTTPHLIQAQLKTRKSLRLQDAFLVPQGRGFILHDFLALLRPIHKPNNQTNP